MKKITYLLLLAFCFISCNNDNVITTENKLTLLVNPHNSFSSEGEEREFTVEYDAKPAISNKAAQNLLMSSDITISLKNNYFLFSDYLISGNTIKFKVSCSENKSKKIIEDEISVRIENYKFDMEVSTKVEQNGYWIR